MKKYMGILLFVLPAALFAQTPAVIQVQKGKQMKVVKTVSMDMDMGMTMTQQSSEYHSLDILDVNDQHVQVRHVLSRTTMNMEAMGRSEAYDSDKASDRDSEMGKSIPADMFKPDTVLVDKKTGDPILPKTSNDAKAGQDDNPMNAMMGAMSTGNKSAVLLELFFQIPAGIAPGGQWKDSVIEKGIKKTSTYTLTDIKDKVALISLAEKMDISTETEMQGMTMQINLVSNNLSTLQVDTTTGLLMDKKTNIEMNGSLDLMGQSQPISAKATSTLVLTQ